ncbi:MAG: signal peptidase I [Clostridia bacterium]|nr:signal peptidase I [Clostridia bacterium]
MSEDKQTPDASPTESTEKKPLFGFLNRKPLQDANDGDEAGDGKKKKKKKTWQQELLEWVVTAVAALAIAIVVRSFIFEPVYVDGNSMYPTLRHGEIMYVSKTSYGAGFLGIPFTNIGTYFNVGGDPERFDVVVCHYMEKGYNVVKRVVGLPGDTVEIIAGDLYVTDSTGYNVGGYDRYGNPLPVDEDFVYHKGTRSYGPYYVPAKGDTLADGTICEEDHYFLLGDNRTNSLDSRDKGPVPRSEITGKVEAVLWHTIPNRLDDQYGLDTN